MNLEQRAKDLLKVHSPEYVIEKLSQNRQHKKADVIKAVNQAKIKQDESSS